MNKERDRLREILGDYEAMDQREKEIIKLITIIIFNHDCYSSRNNKNYCVIAYQNNY